MTTRKRVAKLSASDRRWLETLREAVDLIGVEMTKDLLRMIKAHKYPTEEIARRVLAKFDRRRRKRRDFSVVLDNLAEKSGT